MSIVPVQSLSFIQSAPSLKGQTALSGQAPASVYLPDHWQSSVTPDHTLHAQGKNVGLRLLSKNLGLKADYMEASFYDKTPRDPMDIEAADFNLHVRAGAMHISDVDATLTVEHLLHKAALNKGKPSPVKNLRIAFDDNNRVRVEGKVRALGIFLPFSIQGQVSVSSAGEIRYDLAQAKVAGLPVKALMSVTGLNLDKLLKLRNPAQGYYTSGNTLVVDLGHAISQLEDAPGLQARVRQVSTHLGQLQLVVGDTPEDAARALREKQQKEPAYVKATAGHAYIDGFFIRQGTVHIYDQTPGSPLNLNYQGPERSIQIKRGFIGITEPRFEALIKDEIGDTDDLSNLKTTLKKEGAHLEGKLLGVLPVSMDLKFGHTTAGKLMFTPDNPKVLGFVPLPEGFVSRQVQQLVKAGKPVGRGVAIDGMSGIDLGHITQLVHQNGYIVMEVGEKPQKN